MLNVFENVRNEQQKRRERADADYWRMVALMASGQEPSKADTGKLVAAMALLERSEAQAEKDIAAVRRMYELRKGTKSRASAIEKLKAESRQLHREIDIDAVMRKRRELEDSINATRSIVSKMERQISDHNAENNELARLEAEYAQRVKG